MNILIADDNEDSRLIMSTLLKEKGHKVVDAPNGKIAFDMIKESAPDIIVTDILMPEMDGFELCRQIRANPEYNPVILIIYTGSYKSPADIELGCTIGANEYIIKPQESSALIQLIEKAIIDHKY
jgi:CheY-like chemotaxis protein